MNIYLSVNLCLYTYYLCTSLHTYTRVCVYLCVNVSTESFVVTVGKCSVCVTYIRSM